MNTYLLVSLEIVTLMLIRYCCVYSVWGGVSAAFMSVHSHTEGYFWFDSLALYFKVDFEFLSIGIIDMNHFAQFFLSF